MLSISFRSGMSARSDMRGAMDAGVPLGVVAGLLTTPQLCLTIPGYINQGGLVFADSGAFAELTVGAVLDWRDIMGRYAFMASMIDRHPENLYVVAPDKVGDQDASLKLLATWRDAVRDLIDQGVSVIVPLQRGALSATDLLDRVAGLLGTRSFVAGIPSNKEALSLEECATLRHHAFHVLGRVQLDEAQEARLAALRFLSPNATITADANWLRSRLASVRMETEREREMRREGAKAGVRKLLFALDHPRAAAVARAIGDDPSWGGDASFDMVGARQ